LLSGDAHFTGQSLKAGQSTSSQVLRCERFLLSAIVSPSRTRVKAII
jgi:hypothetical protein